MEQKGGGGEEREIESERQREIRGKGGGRGRGTENQGNRFPLKYILRSVMRHIHLPRGNQRPSV